MENRSVFALFVVLIAIKYLAYGKGTILAETVS